MDRDPCERIADAAPAHRFTGVAPTEAPHIPWDRVDGYAALTAYAREQGVELGSVNANVPQDDGCRLGSVTNPDHHVRRKAIGHPLECLDIMDAAGSRDLELWFSDGTNHPGQDNIRQRQDRLAAALRESYGRLTGDQRAQRRARAAALAPVSRRLTSTGRPQVGHFTDSDTVLDLDSRAEHPRLAALGTSRPEHFLRTKVRPMVPDLPPDAPQDAAVARLRELHEKYRRDYRGHYGR